MGGAGFTANLMHIVHQFVGVGSQLCGDMTVVLFKNTGIHQLVDILHADTQFFK